MSENENLVRVAINNSTEKRTLHTDILNLDDTEIGFEGVIGETKYKFKASLKELVFRYYDWYELIEFVNDHSNNPREDVCILAKGD